MAERSTWVCYFSTFSGQVVCLYSHIVWFGDLSGAESENVGCGVQLPDVCLLVAVWTFIQWLEIGWRQALQKVNACGGETTRSKYLLRPLFTSHMAYNHTTPYHLHLNMYTIHLNHCRSAEAAGRTLRIRSAEIPPCRSSTRRGGRRCWCSTRRDDRTVNPLGHEVLVHRPGRPGWPSRARAARIAVGV